MRALTASAHGPCTCMPYGECKMIRQSPTSSRERSTVSVRSVGNVPVASFCSARYARRFPIALSSRPDSRNRAVAFSAEDAATSRENAPSASPSSAGRPRPSPCQNGSLPGCPKAGSTLTRSWVISTIRQLVVPSVKTSLTRDS